MLAGKNLFEYTSWFLLYDFKKIYVWAILKMDDLSNQIQFRLEKINKVEDYFIAEIWQRKQMSKKLSKYISAFDYFDKILMILSAAGDEVSITHFTNASGAPVGILRVTFSFAFSLTTGIIKKLLQITRDEKKKSNKIVMLTRSRLNSIETLTSKALIDYKISD